MFDYAPSIYRAAKRRRSRRLAQNIPLMVMGVDASGRFFKERTSTVTLNCHGCKYQSKNNAPKDSWVTLEIFHSKAGREPKHVRARVVWMHTQKTVLEMHDVGVALETPGNVWGLDSAPEDWFPAPDSAESLPSADQSVSGATEGASAPPPPGKSNGAQPGLPGPSAADASAEHAQNETEAQPASTVEDKIREFPRSSAASSTAQIIRTSPEAGELARESEAQFPGGIRDFIASAVAEEIDHIMARREEQFRAAWEKNVKTAIVSSAEQVVRRAIDKIQETHQTNAKGLQQELTRDLECVQRDSGEKLTAQLAHTAEAYRQNFGKQLEADLGRTAERLKEIEQRIKIELGGIAADAKATQVRLRDFQKSLDDSVQAAGKLWQENLVAQTEGARAGLTELEQHALKLNSEIIAVTRKASVDWRQEIESDLVAVGNQWNAQVESSLTNAMRRLHGEVAEIVKIATREAQAAASSEQHEEFRTKWLEDLEAHSTSIAQTTYQAMFKASDWHQKKTQANLQSLMEKTVDQAVSSLREKTTEVSQGFTAQLQQLGRTCAEEAGRTLVVTRDELVARTQAQLTETIGRTTQTSAAKFAEEANRIATQQLHKLAESSEAALNAALQKQSRLSIEALEEHRTRLESASKSAIAASLGALDQRTQQIVDSVCKASEQRLRDTCTQLVTRVADTVRQRLLGLAADLHAGGNLGPSD